MTKNCMNSPYQDLEQNQWIAKTEELIQQHPLSLEIIKEITLKSWDTLWNTTIGQENLSIKLSELNIPATVVGYFFEKLFAKEIQTRYPENWCGGQSKEDKDIIYIPDDLYSIEIKTSGQLGKKIFGNRSYGQESLDSGLSKKDKSGYYITINFYQMTINLIRFGWIDYSDWKSQKSESGQSATLKPEVYKYKLITIPGDYRLNAPISFIDGIGKKTAQIFQEEGIDSLRDLVNYQGNNEKLIQFKAKIEEYE